MLPSAEFSTRSGAVSAMTWLFVSTSPFDEITTPVPAAAPPVERRVVMLTIESSSFAAMRRDAESIERGALFEGNVKSVGRWTTASSRWPIVYPTTPAIARASAAVSRTADRPHDGRDGGGGGGGPTVGSCVVIIVRLLARGKATPPCPLATENNLLGRRFHPVAGSAGAQCRGRARLPWPAGPSGRRAPFGSVM